MVCNRILIKLSGEMLSGIQGYGLEKEALLSITQDLQQAYQTGTQIGVVIGAGNIMRGASTEFLTRNKADNAGMLGTVINAIALQDTLEKNMGIDSVILGSFGIDGMFPKASPQLIEECFKNNKMILFAGGTGAPYFSTDTTGVLKALEINADLMVKATKVDGIYDKDPIKHKDAKKYHSISYQDVLIQRLNVMDLTAISLAMENNLPLRVVNLSGDNLKAIINGKSIGTLVS